MRLANFLTHMFMQLCNFVWIGPYAILNFSCSNCRSHPHGVGCNAVAQKDSKVYTSEGDVRLPLDYRQNPLGNSANNAWTFTSYGATRCIACDCRSRLSSEENTFLCHGNHGEQCTDANTGLAGLALALTVHAVLEGLAIGLQTKIAEVCCTLLLIIQYNK